MSSTDSERYDVFFAGECLEGQDPQRVKEAIGRLFKADAKTLDRLFCGQRQRIKSDCDGATARRYEKALTAAGAKVSIARAAASAPRAAAASDPGRLTLADVGAQLGPAAAVEAAAIAPPDFNLAEVGADLGPAPSAPPPAPNTSNLSLASADSDLSDCAPEPAQAPALDLSHMDLAEAGSDLLSEAERSRPPAAAPDTSHLTLEPDPDKPRR